MSQEQLKKLGVKPLAKIVSYADAEIEPIDFSIAPHYSAKKALAKAGLGIEAIDFVELNEAFSAVSLANMKLLDISHQKINIFGGAVALGHPIGVSGARIVQSLLSAFRLKGGKYGLAAICNGGGGSTAMIVENLLWYLIVIVINAVINYYGLKYMLVIKIRSLATKVTIIFGYSFCSFSPFPPLPCASVIEIFLSSSLNKPSVLYSHL